MRKSYSINSSTSSRVEDELSLDHKLLSNNSFNTSVTEETDSPPRVLTVGTQDPHASLSIKIQVGYRDVICLIDTEADSTVCSEAFYLQHGSPELVPYKGPRI